TRLASLFINESKVLFLCIHKLTLELILALARECAKHLRIADINASDAKKKGCGWFSIWR
ncbi:15241_t:CDS:1, partial [Funneliformis mosseae]